MDGEVGVGWGGGGADGGKEGQKGGLCVVTGRTLETGCNKGALKFTPVPPRRERFQNELSIPPMQQQLAAEDIGSGRGLNHCHRFIGRGSLWVGGWAGQGVEGKGVKG